MREFEFRAWNKCLKTYIDWTMICAYHDLTSLISNDGVIIEQYTGLKDKNKNKIYEGDRLFDEHNEEWATVIFDDGKFFAKFETCIIDLWEVCDDLDVRGTIHDSLEFLESN